MKLPDGSWLPSGKQPYLWKMAMENIVNVPTENRDFLYLYVKFAEASWLHMPYIRIIIRFFVTLFGPG